MLANALDLPDDSKMIPRAHVKKTRVLIVSDHPAESREVASNLRRLDLDVQLCLFDGKTLSAIPNRAPNAVLCHLVDYPSAGPKLARVIRAHYKSLAIPLVGAMSRPSPDASVGFDSTLFAPMHASQIANRVNAMIRLGVMEGEITRRLETLRDDFGQNLNIDDLSPDRKFRVLFIGKASPSFMVIINALQDKGVEVTAAFTSFSAFDYLHSDTFDAVVMNTLEQNEPAFSICKAMQRNSKLYHTPTLFLVDGDKFTAHEAAYEHGANDIIDQNSDSDEISGRILELANYHRIHEQMKKDYSVLALKDVQDKSGKAYSQDFIRAHLPRVIRDAQKINAPVSLIGVKLQPNTVDSVSLDAIEKAYVKTADLIQNLIRMQDIVCRWTDDILVLGFFDTDRSAAENILTRINALLACTIYDNGDVGNGTLSVTTQSTIMEITPESNLDRNHLDGLIKILNQDPDQH